MTDVLIALGAITLILLMAAGGAFLGNFIASLIFRMFDREDQ